MLHFTPTIQGALKTWFADLFSSIAISGNGVTLLAAQITDLENRCKTMRHRIDQQRAKKKAGQAFAARVLPRKIERKTKYGTNGYSEQCALPRAT
jgi:putative protein kinase ArgK-like GTPase of G3E family